MKRIAFIVVPFLMACKGYCQKMYGYFYTRHIPDSINNKYVKLEKNENEIGFMIGNEWYPISKNPIRGELYDIINSDTIEVYNFTDNVRFNLILSPNLRAEFQDSISWHWSHASHASHSAHGSHYSARRILNE